MSRILGFLCLVMLTAGCAVKIIPPAADPDQLLQPITEQVSTLRGLPAIEPVRLKQASPAQVREILAQELDQEIPPDRLEAERQLYLALGLIPPDFDLRQALLDLYAGEIAAFYLPDRDTLTVVTPLRKPLLALQSLVPGGQRQLREIILSHELVHALEDQHFHLERFSYQPGANEDFLLAMQAVSEGSALLVGTMYLLHQTGAPSPQALEFFVRRLQQQKLRLSSRDCPAVLTAPMVFAYQAGLRFVHEVYQARGLEGINALYQETALSTAHILHPEKYLAGSGPPLALELPDLSVLPAGWKLLVKNTMGEFGVSLILEQRLSRSEAQSAAAGWAGDIYALFEDPRGRLLFLWYSAWETPTEALEFHQALSHWTAQKSSAAEAFALYIADQRVLFLLGPSELSFRPIANLFQM